MGRMEKIYDERIISSEPSRNPNLIRVFKAPNGEVTIHFRNMKIVLHDDMEVAEWRDGFREALDEINSRKTG